MRSFRRGLVRDTLESNPRIVIVGDSFASAMLNASRIGASGIYHTWPFSGGVRALYVPAGGTGTWAVDLTEFGTATTSHPYDTGFATPIGGATNQGIRKLDNDNLDYEAGLDWPATTSQQWYGLPFGEAQEEYLTAARAPAGGGADRLFQIRLTLDNFDDGENPRFAASGEDMRARIFYRHTTDPADQREILNWAEQVGLLPDDVLNLKTGESRPLWSSGSNPESDAPTNPTAGDCNAHHEDLVWIGPASGSAQFEFQATAGDNTIFSCLGMLLYSADDTDGAYIQVLADASWSYAGHGLDVASSSSEPKRYTTAQLSRFLDLSTLDITQETLVVVSIAHEPGTFDDLRDEIQAIVDKYRAAFALIRAGAPSMPEPKFLLIGQVNHYISGALNAAQIEVNQRAMLSVAEDNHDVAFVSLYAITGGVLLDGSATAQTQMSAMGWGVGALFLHGSYADDLSGGLGLDGSNLHPSGRPFADWYAWLIYQELFA